MGHIDWIPIAEMPDALKDGRRVILWATDIASAEVAEWEDGIWVTPGGSTVRGETHFAEINPPDGEPWTPVFPGPLVWTEDYKGNP